MNENRKLYMSNAADVARADGIGEPQVVGVWKRTHSGGNLYVDTFHNFHEWLEDNTERDDPIGDLARDYVQAVREGLHDMLDGPDDLRRIVRFLVGEGSDTDHAVDAAEREWNALRVNS